GSIRIGEAHGGTGFLRSERAIATRVARMRNEEPTMAKTTSNGLSAEEREAVKQRAKELREQEKAGKNREAGEKSVRDAIAALEPDDKALAEGFYKVVSEVAPTLVPKTYYGMPGFANADGKMFTFIQPAKKFNTRYATIGFEDKANLDDGDLWPVGFAVTRWTPEVEQRGAELARSAISCTVGARTAIRSCSDKQHSDNTWLEA